MAVLVDPLLTISRVVLAVDGLVLLAEVVLLSACILALFRATLGRHRALRLLDSG
ncbi:hypothetical protein ACF1BB_30445 [Streptomyces griseoluteus]|uniref:hypothetical protein n=1 Tax=Streptomyces griseoluteus TaxID=29306 RepID=UPI00370201E7